MFIIEEFADGGDLLSLMFKYGGKIPEVGTAGVASVRNLPGLIYGMGVWWAGARCRARASTAGAYPR